MTGVSKILEGRVGGGGGGFCLVKGSNRVKHPLRLLFPAAASIQWLAARRGHAMEETPWRPKDP